MGETRARVRSIEAALAKGRRVYLRPIVRSDRREWCALRDASVEHLTPWEPRLEAAAEEVAPARFEQIVRTTQKDSARRWVIVRRRDEALLGMVNLSQIFRGSFHNAMMGYWIGAEHAGRGYAREGVALGLRCVFTDLALHRVEANVMPTNTRSLALVRALGFREEGFSPRYLQINGAWADHLRFAMTAEDWASRTSASPDSAI